MTIGDKEVISQVLLGKVQYGLNILNFVEMSVIKDNHIIIFISDFFKPVKTDNIGLDP